MKLLKCRTRANSGNSDWLVSAHIGSGDTVVQMVPLEIAEDWAVAQSDQHVEVKIVHLTGIHGRNTGLIEHVCKPVRKRRMFTLQRGSKVVLFLIGSVPLAVREAAVKHAKKQLCFNGPPLRFSSCAVVSDASEWLHGWNLASNEGAYAARAGDGR